MSDITDMSQFENTVTGPSMIHRQQDDDAHHCMNPLPMSDTDTDD